MTALVPLVGEVLILTLFVVVAACGLILLGEWVGERWLDWREFSADYDRLRVQRRLARREAMLRHPSNCRLVASGERPVASVTPIRKDAS